MCTCRLIRHMLSGCSCLEQLLSSRFMFKTCGCFATASGNNILNHAGPWTCSPVSNLGLLFLRKIFVYPWKVADILGEMEASGGQPSEAVEEAGNKMLPICDAVAEAVAPLVRHTLINDVIVGRYSMFSRFKSFNV